MAERMGQIHKPPLAALALDIAGACGLRDFLETGTFMGDSLSWAAQNFERVWTIEINANYHASARDRNFIHKNINYSLGDSAAVLPGVFAEMNASALCWFDAHAGAGFFAPNDDCPLLSELDAAAGSKFDHCIFVDDARAFVAPPPPPFNFRKWPTLDEIFTRVLARRHYHAVMIADALIIVPRQYRDLVADHCFRMRPSI